MKKLVKTNKIRFPKTKCTAHSHHVYYVRVVSFAEVPLASNFMQMLTPAHITWNIQLKLAGNPIRYTVIDCIRRETENCVRFEHNSQSEGVSHSAKSLSRCLAVDDCRPTGLQRHYSSTHLRVILLPTSHSWSSNKHSISHGKFLKFPLLNCIHACILSLNRSIQQLPLAISYRSVSKAE